MNNRWKFGVLFAGYIKLIIAEFNVCGRTSIHTEFTHLQYFQYQPNNYKIAIHFCVYTSLDGSFVAQKLLLEAKVTIYLQQKMLLKTQRKLLKSPKSCRAQLIQAYLQRGLGKCILPLFSSIRQPTLEIETSISTLQAVIDFGDWGEIHGEIHARTRGNGLQEGKFNTTELTKELAIDEQAKLSRAISSMR